jgi:hypothetical protein
LDELGNFVLSDRRAESTDGQTAAATTATATV